MDYSRFVRKVGSKLVYDVLGYVPRHRPFVFGVGLSRTGTTSLSNALDIIGYRSFHLPPIADVDTEGNIVPDWPGWVFKYNALTDITVAVLYRELAEQFPNACFIYTRRDLEKWLNSCRRHFTEELSELRVAQDQEYLNRVCSAFYGSEIFDRESYTNTYLTHEEGVLDFFEDHPRFLSYDLTSGLGWEPLCDFLERPVPDEAFPVSNVGRAQ